MIDGPPGRLEWDSRSNDRATRTDVQRSAQDDEAPDPEDRALRHVSLRCEAEDLNLHALAGAST